MRHALALSATVLALAWAAPASAQMCGGSPSTTGATASAPAGGGMCGMMGRSAQASDPMATPSPQPGQRAAGGCPCCRMMAMMQGGQSGGMGGMMGGGMGGMQMPSQPQTPQTTPGAPETPQTPRPQ
jgi:hypothetical protein